MSQENQLTRTLGTQHVVVAGISIVVAASTLVSDFQGYIGIGAGFIISLFLGFGVNLLLGISVGKLAAAYPRAGTIYNYTKAIVGGQWGSYLGLMLGLTFYLTLSFAISGEALAGAYAFRSLIGWEVSQLYFVVLLFGLALLANIFDFKTTTWIAAILLIGMMGIRWLFGLSGFFEGSMSGTWSWSNLSAGELTLLGSHGLISAGLALAIWTFLGIEFCGTLAEEVKRPRKTISRGIFIALIIILVTSLVMGTGVAGFMPRSDWETIIQSELGCQGECPQLAIGQTMLGDTGFVLMALGSVFATLSSLILVLAAMPRMLYALTRDEGPGHGPAALIKQLHPKTGTPINATCLTFCLYLIPPMLGEGVTDWIFSAAYIWLLIYTAYHALRAVDIIKRRKSRSALWIPVLGLAGTVVSIFFAFYGGHQYYGLRALFLLAIAAIVTIGLKGNMKRVFEKPSVDRQEVIT